MISALVRAENALAAWGLGATLVVLLAQTACRRGDEALLHPTQLAEVSAPSADPEGLCGDFGDHRLCWAAACSHGVCVRPRPLPRAIEPYASDYRCTGSGEVRECAPRNQRAPAFQCRGARCSQAEPRLPDDGEWECSDLSGVVLCRGGSEPAAVVRASVDPGWLCGARRGAKNGERVCLDLDPDLPDGRSLRACHFEIDGARMRRVCERADKPLLGDACTHSDLCPPGSQCEVGTCLLPRPFPNCWGDADCGLGQCRFGTCSQGAE